MNYKGGRIKRSGYWYIKTKDHPYSGKQGYVAEHRLVMEEQLGRFLKPKETVHHLNGDRSDNRFENLELCSSNGQHTLKHHPEVIEKLIKATQTRVKNGWKPPNYARTRHACKNCGKTFKANPNRKRKFCSHNCYGESKKGHKPTKKQLEALKLGRRYWPR